MTPTSWPRRISVRRRPTETDPDGRAAVDRGYPAGNQLAWKPKGMRRGRCTVAIGPRWTSRASRTTTSVAVARVVVDRVDQPAGVFASAVRVGCEHALTDMAVVARRPRGAITGAPVVLHDRVEVSDGPSGREERRHVQTVRPDAVVVVVDSVEVTRQVVEGFPAGSPSFEVDPEPRRDTGRRVRGGFVEGARGSMPKSGAVIREPQNSIRFPSTQPFQKCCTWPASISYQVMSVAPPDAASRRCGRRSRVASSPSVPRRGSPC